MRYVSARYEQEKRAEVYRIMVTESLRVLHEGKYVTVSYQELIKPQKVEEQKSGEQVADEVAAKMGTKVDWGR